MLTHFQPLPDLKIRCPELFWALASCFSSEKKVALGLSGGSDSMFLAFLIATFWEEQKWNPDQLFFLHCNHQMRKESDEEERFLHSFFKEWNFVCFKRENSWSASEEALRSWRYECFEQFCREHQIDQLALGHNLTDRIETSLMNLVRGCGLPGFLNMELIDSHYLLGEIQLLRPLLSLSKQKIEAECQALEIPFVQDQTNFDTTTSLRNKIRNEFLFPLSALSAKNAEGELSFFESWKLVYQEIKKSDTALWLVPIRKNPYRNAQFAYERRAPVWTRTELSVLGELFTQLKIPLIKWELLSLQQWLGAGEDGFRELGDWTIFLSHEQIFIIHGKKRFREKELQLEKELRFVWIQTFWNFQLEIWEALIGAKLRFPKEGDRFQGKQLKKRMINQKIPIFWRNSLPLAEKEGKIIFVFRPQHLLW